MSTCLKLAVVLLLTIPLGVWLSILQLTWHSSGITSALPDTDFTIVTAFSADHEFINSNVGSLGLQVGIKTMSAYTLKHNYHFEPVFVGPQSPDHISWARVYRSMQLIQEHIAPVKPQLRAALWGGAIRNRRTPPGLDSGRHSSKWIVWLESDAWITNTSISLDSIVTSTVQQGTKEPSVIVSRDAQGNLNTGVAFIKMSTYGLQFLSELIQCKETERSNWYVDVWHDNGCAILLHNQQKKWKEEIHVSSGKAFNAYPFISWEEKAVIPCQKSECFLGYWGPGDFIAHFAGMPNKGMAMAVFLRSYPPRLWGIDSAIYPSSAIAELQ